MIGEVVVERLGLFRWEARRQVTLFAWVAARGWTRRGARRNLYRLVEP